MKLVCSKEFIEKVKKIYPNEIKLHQYLEQGNIIAGRYLDNLSYTSNINTEKDALYKEFLNFKTQNKPVTKEFIEKVKLVYPKFQDLYDYIENGSYIAERYLDALRFEAPKKNDKKVALYVEWVNMYRNLLKETGLSR